MMTTIQIPSVNHDDRIGSVFNQLFSIINATELSESDVVEWDFSETDFLHPFFIGPLSIYKQSCFKKIKCCNKNTIVSSYHRAISFDATYHISGHLQDDAFLSYYRGKTYTPIFSFPANDVAISDKLEQIVQSIIRSQTHYGPSLQAPLSYILSELVCNIHQHSRARQGYIYCQYLKAEHTINLCIADDGYGILGSYIRTRTHLNEVVNDAIALQYANNGYSTKGLPERGFGLRTSRSVLVDGLGGAYFMLSGSAFYRHQKDGEGAVLLPPGIIWNGTIILLRIPIDIPKDFSLYPYLEN